MQHVGRIAGSFVIVVITYWAYALLAVPWIEPSIKLSDQNHARAPDMSDLVKEQLKQVERYFPGDRLKALGLTTSKLIQLGSATLLVQKYSNLPGNVVKIEPFVVVMAYEGSAESEEQRQRQAIIMEAPDGALLRFDGPVDIGQFKGGHLKGGQLVGPITIRSDWKQPGPDDDLLITTRDIELVGQTVSTPNPVDFRWGPHCGRGRDMVMKLSTGAPRIGMEAAGPNITGIESFELRQVERLYLDLGQAMASGPPGGNEANVPVEIHCRGPFRFDVTGRVATFSDHVEVRKLNAGGPADQLHSDVLALYFVDRRAAKTDPVAARAAAGEAGSMDLVAERIEARGNPVVVTAPSQQLNALAPRIEHNLLEKSIKLDGGPDVFLQQGPNAIHAASLYYRAAERGRLGQVVAQGPGRLRGQMTDRPDQQVNASWKDTLKVFPDGQDQEIALSGGAELNFPGMGLLQAQEICLWLAETPPMARNAQPTLRPQRMRARDPRDHVNPRDHVHMNSPQLSGEVEELDVWFQEATKPPAVVDATKPRPVVAPAGFQGSPVGRIANPSYGEQGPGVGRIGNSSYGTPGPAYAAGNPPSPFPRPPSSDRSAVQRFKITGRVLQAEVLLGGPQPGVSRLAVEDNVRFFEEQPPQPGEQRLMAVHGDRLVVTDASGAGAAVTIIGRPAQFRGRGLELTGAAIKLDRGANRLSIEGNGQMTFSGEVQGQPAAAPDGLTVTWQQWMNFDGQTATFEGSVVAESKQQRLDTKTLQVQLQRPIRFSEPNLQGQAEIEKVRCLGGASMKSRSLDQQQQLIAYDQIEVTDLLINRLNGELQAGGPGWLNSVRPGSGGLTRAPAVPAPDAAAPAGSQLYCLNVKFQGSITGNIWRRQLTFHKQVRTAYAPVGNNWNAMLTDHNPDRLGPQGVTLRCDDLSVVEMLTPFSKVQSVEMNALGNAVVEGTTYTARANRISYAEAKDLLILEGDGRSDAELFRQLQKGAEVSKAAARQIFYWPKTNRFRINDLQSVESGPVGK